MSHWKNIMQNKTMIGQKLMQYKNKIGEVLQNLDQNIKKWKTWDICLANMENLFKKLNIGLIL